MAEPQALRVFICDDVPELRLLVRYAFEELGDMEVVGEADDASLGIPMIAELRPDAVVLDLSMRGIGGLEAIPGLRAAAPDTAIVVYSGFLEGTVGADAIARGADGYMNKSEPLTRLAELIAEVVAARAGGAPGQS